jgi:hypothetical protein
LRELLGRPGEKEVIFALILFGCGPILQLGGHDFSRYQIVRFRIQFMWRGIARTVYQKTRLTDMELYGA